MPAKKHDITIEQGATFIEVFEWYVSSGGALVDVSSYAARMQIRPTTYADSATVSLTSSAGGGISLGATLGTVRVTITASDTSALVSDGFYDLEMIDVAGTVTRLANGKVILSEEVTR